MALTLSNLKQALSQIASKAGATKAAILLFNAIGGGGGAVTSVFGRVGAVVAAIGDYTFAQIGSTPTTLGGYGITDGVATSRTIGTTSPVTGGGDLSANRTIGLDVSVDHAFTEVQTITKDDAANNTVTDVLKLVHSTSGAASAGIGTGILFRTENTAGVVEDTIQLRAGTSNDTASVVGTYFEVANRVGGAALLNRLRLHASGGFSVNNTTDPGAGIISANTGYIVGVAASTSGKILKSDGSKFTASSETYAAPGTSGNILTSDGTNWLSSAPASPTAPLTLTLTNATTAAVDNILILDHESSGTPAAGFGEAVAFKLASNTTASRDAGAVKVRWANATDANRDSQMDVFLESNGGASLTKVATFGSVGEMAVGATATLSALAGVISADAGYVIAGTKPAQGRFLHATAALDKYKNSVYSLPTAAGGLGTILQWNGSDVVTSTPTWPTTAGAAGGIVQSDGTNLVMAAIGFVAGGKTSSTTINDTVTYTTGGITYAAPAIGIGHVYRVRAHGTFVAVNSATARNAQVACFWGTTQLTAITQAVAASVAITSSWRVEFDLVGTSTTAIWTTGNLISHVDNQISTTPATAIVNTNTPASTVVTSGAQTLDLRFSMSVAVATDQWVVHQVTMERLK